jgi:hypothetical protein
MKKLSEWKDQHRDHQLIIASRLPLDKNQLKLASIEVNMSK